MITRTKDNKFKIETEEDSPAENNNSEENDANAQYDDNDENDEENKKHSERITKKTVRFEYYSFILICSPLLYYN